MPTLLALAGCSAEVGPSYEDPVPAARIAAIRQSADSPAAADLRRLVENLDDNDPTVRLAAIGTLRRLTGDTLGYRFNAAANERLQSIERWKEWLAAHGAQPATSAAPLPSGHGVPPA